MKLFVYGTLREPRIEKKVIGRIVKETKHTLRGYKRIKSGSYFALIQDKKSKVSGFLMNVTNQELKKIDKYEGKAYKRRKVAINHKKVWTYIKA